MKANAAIVPAGSGAAISVFATHTTDVILDINGYFVPTPKRLHSDVFPAAALPGSGHSLEPWDRWRVPFLAGGQSRSFPVRSSTCNVPSTAHAYSLNFTAVPHGPLGYITTWPTGSPQPLVSTLNAPTGTVTANAAVVPAGTTGQINVFATNDTDLVIDINGYFAPAAAGWTLVVQPGSLPDIGYTRSRRRAAVQWGAERQCCREFMHCSCRSAGIRIQRHGGALRPVGILDAMAADAGTAIGVDA